MKFTQEMVKLSSLVKIVFLGTAHKGSFHKYVDGGLFFDTNYRSQSQIENIPLLRHLISMHMYGIHDPLFKVNLSRNKEKQTDNISPSIMTPHFYEIICKI